MVLYFKTDEENRIWLLFCTGIKVRDKFGSNTKEDLSLIRMDSPLFRVIRKDEEPPQRNISNQVKFNDGII